MEYFTHPHPLQQLFCESTFNCKRCDSVGCGSRFRCSVCNFDFHEDCAKYSYHLNDLNHPQHLLNLVKCTGKSRSRFCAACKELAVGLIYTCPTCHFNVHTYCATKAVSSPTSTDSNNEDVPNDHPKKRWRKRDFCLKAGRVIAVQVICALTGIPSEILID